MIFINQPIYLIIQIIQIFQGQMTSKIHKKIYY